ncbi:hypothetical protein [Cupriavidus sp. TMH.W2]|uniref:hypothetical protein n=1 Tax=Cupriavidus sp. TMH.W2 TaxID=3434465 RepID=UPI003D78017C
MPPREWVEARIAGNDWAGLDLPAPEALRATLLSGASTTVADHFLQYDDGVVWYCNPYGVDGLLGAEPDLALMRRFLTTVALGQIYGPTPDTSSQ